MGETNEMDLTISGPRKSRLKFGEILPGAKRLASQTKPRTMMELSNQSNLQFDPIKPTRYASLNDNISKMSKIAVENKTNSFFDSFKKNDASGWENLSNHQNTLKGIAQIAPGLFLVAAPGAGVAAALKIIQDKKVKKGEDPEKQNKAMPYVVGGTLSAALLANAISNKDSTGALHLIKQTGKKMPSTYVKSIGQKLPVVGGLTNNMSKKINMHKKAQGLTNKIFEKTAEQWEFDTQRFVNNMQRTGKKIPTIARDAVIAAAVPTALSLALKHNIRKNFEKIESKDIKKDKDKKGSIYKSAAQIPGQQSLFNVKQRPTFSIGTPQVGKQPKKVDEAVANMLGSAVSSVVKVGVPSAIALLTGRSLYNDFKKIPGRDLSKEEKGLKKELQKQKIEKEALEQNPTQLDISDVASETQKGALKDSLVAIRPPHTNKKDVFSGLKKKKS